MSKKLEVDGQVLQVAEASVNNPHLRTVTFILADDKPNSNKQAVAVEEFDALAASAIGMPIKMRFLGKKSGVGSHYASIPVGHIQGVEKETLDNGVNRLVAEGVIYAFEYPDIIEYLDEALAEDRAPGISYEMGYTDSVVEKGIEWLRGVIARAATFVRNPAYGKRTALLALASDQTLTEEQLEQEVNELFVGQPNEGGTDDVDLEQALARIKELEGELATQKEEMTSKASEIETLSATASRVTELEGTVVELEDKIATFEKATLITDRTEKAVAAGYVLDTDAEKLEKKQELWASMAEEIFNEYVSDLSAVASKVPAKTAQASARTLSLPKITPSDAGSTSAISDNFRDRIRGLTQSLKPTE